MQIYGEDATASPPIPGMRDGETVAFYVDGQPATPSPSLVWHDDKNYHRVDLAVSGPSVLVPLALGWNLTSLPLIPVDPSPAAVLSSIAGGYDEVWAYDACDTADQWKKHIPGGTDNDLTALDVRHGYWLHTTAAVTLTVTGSQPTTTTIPLCTGWNLIGYPSSTARPVAEALASIAGKYDLVQGYDPARPAALWRRYDPALSPALNTLTELAPGRGYWVHMTQVATLVLLP